MRFINNPVHFRCGLLINRQILVSFAFGRSGGVTAHWCFDRRSCFCSFWPKMNQFEIVLPGLSSGLRVPKTVHFGQNRTSLKSFSPVFLKNRWGSGLSLKTRGSAQTAVCSMWEDFVQWCWWCREVVYRPWRRSRACSDDGCTIAYPSGSCHSELTGGAPVLEIFRGGGVPNPTQAYCRICYGVLHPCWGHQLNLGQSMNPSRVANYWQWPFT